MFYRYTCAHRNYKSSDIYIFSIVLSSKKKLRFSCGYSCKFLFLRDLSRQLFHPRVPSEYFIHICILRAILCMLAASNFPDVRINHQLTYNCVYIRLFNCYNNSKYYFITKPLFVFFFDKEEFQERFNISSLIVKLFWHERFFFFFRNQYGKLWRKCSFLKSMPNKLDC